MNRVAAADTGFTLVELMVVVLIIGILVSIAVPVFASARGNAEAKACMANQRTIAGAATMYAQTGGNTASASLGEFADGGSGWYAILIPDWIRNKPTCPKDGANYTLNISGALTGDSGGATTFKAEHAAP